MDVKMPEQAHPFLMGFLLSLMALLAPLDHVLATDWLPVVKTMGGLLIPLAGGFLYKAGQRLFDWYFPDRRGAQLSAWQRWRNRRKRTDLNLKD